MSPETLISLLIGSVVSWVASWFYYKRAGDELKLESEQARKLSTIMLMAMEENGWVKLKRDDSGNIRAMISRLHGTGGFEVRGTGRM
jgi:hypothetical protein